jgi:hypothetical protein
MRIQIPTALCSLMAGAVLTQANPKLINQAADTWATVSSTKLVSVCPNPYVGGNNGCKAVTESWNGGVYIDDYQKMVVWGGGHGDYFGNEVYGFKLDSLKWEIVQEPSRLPALTDMDPLLDGKPVSRHTYDGMAYVAHSKKLFAYGGSRAGNGYGTTVTWTFDMPSKNWKNMLPTGTGPNTTCCNMSSDYDAYSKKVIYRDPNYVFEYDPDLNKWTRLLEWSHDWGPQKSVIIPGRRLFFTVGSGEFLVYDIAAKKNVTADWKTTGGDAILKAYGPGMAYDYKTDQLVAYAGGGVYVLDLKTKAWTRKSSAGAPAAQSLYGTYGRFRYVREFNVFILVNNADQDVYFYKLSSGEGASAVHPGTGRVEQGARELILDSGLRSIRVPLDDSQVPTQVSVYDTHGRVVSRIENAQPGRMNLSLPKDNKVFIIQATVGGRQSFRSVLVGG